MPAQGFEAIGTPQRQPLAQPQGLRALPQPQQLTQLQKLMQLFQSMRQPYGQDVRQAQLGTY
jgi:hypothetical protein